MGPYLRRDGVSYCARCGRMPLSFDAESRTAFCRHCDEGEVPDLAHYPIGLVDGEIYCARCGLNVMTNTGPDGTLECPSCDMPPWERAAALEPQRKQLTLMDGTEMTTFDDIEQRPDRPPRPADVVRRCRECRQTTSHYWAWKFHRWRAMCPGCGHMMSGVRERPNLGKPKRGVRK
jgi:uncharacterized Zn finger protein (UPF0148 family)